ncbi:7856_t:CDS:2 [Ambispora leptoticha]|uniref:7856_t:CDS:1 n=1 Tax=Ambispora leptoticha TaxID=144679 RepID=A0A9N9AJI7_9GLOM|nr:7856_t:CDS:2 [Ambispora leptoticha]
MSSHKDNYYYHRKRRNINARSHIHSYSRNLRHSNEDRKDRYNREHRARGKTRNSRRTSSSRRTSYYDRGRNIWRTTNNQETHGIKRHRSSDTENRDRQKRRNNNAGYSHDTYSGSLKHDRKDRNSRDSWTRGKTRNSRRISSSRRTSYYDRGRNIWRTTNNQETHGIKRHRSSDTENRDRQKRRNNNAGYSHDTYSGSLKHDRKDRYSRDNWTRGKTHNSRRISSSRRTSYYDRGRNIWRTTNNQETHGIKRHRSSDAEKRGRHKRRNNNARLSHDDTYNIDKEKSHANLQPDLFLPQPQFTRNRFMLSPNDPATTPVTSQVDNFLADMRKMHEASSVQVEPLNNTISELYEILEKVGEGVYGIVFKARSRKTGQIVALKKIKMESEEELPLSLREIMLLRALQNDHIVNLLEAIITRDDVYLVFEYMEHDLKGVLYNPQLQLDVQHIKCLMLQLLEGLAVVHEHGILHRDIKCNNILLNNRGELKLGDFGLARRYNRKRQLDYTSHVVPLCYRAPELILGATKYGPGIDVWSVGCLLVELLARKPLFQGKNEWEQLNIIFQLLGSPSLEEWPDVIKLPQYYIMAPEMRQMSRFREEYKELLTPATMELAEALLTLNPERRPSARDALDFNFFKEEPMACLPEE